MYLTGTGTPRQGDSIELTDAGIWRHAFRGPWAFRFPWAMYSTISNEFASGQGCRMTSVLFLQRCLVNAGVADGPVTPATDLLLCG